MNFGSVFIFAHNWSECSFSLFHLGFYQELIFYSDPHQNKCFEAMTKAAALTAEEKANALMRQSAAIQDEADATVEFAENHKTNGSF